MLAAASLGGVHQVGGVPRQGPQLSAALTLSRAGRVEPYLSLHDRELVALQAVQTLTRLGEETTWTGTRYSSRGASLGMRVPVQPQLCLDLALQAGVVDNTFAIPAVSVGISWRSRP